MTCFGPPDQGAAGHRGGNAGRRPGRARRPGRFILAALLTSLFLAGCGYSQIEGLAESAGEARSEIELQLQRRAELVPTLLQEVSSYGAIGQGVIQDLAASRVELVDAIRTQDLSSIEQASAKLSAALQHLMAEVRRHPGLQADPGFELLRSQLQGTEDEIMEAGRMYNDAASRYNAFIEGFPQVLTAKMVGAERLEKFDPPGLPASLSTADG